MAEEGMLTSQTPAQTFTFFKGVEKGDANPSALYNRSESSQVTEQELRDYFNDRNSAMLRQAFGDFDNYLAYMTEREQLIQSGDYDVGNWEESVGGLSEDQLMLLEGEDLFVDPSDPQQNIQNIRLAQQQSQQSEYERWVNSEANQALLNKYGVGSTILNDDGDRYEWNGSAYVKTFKTDDSLSIGDYLKIGIALAAGAATGGAASSALSSALGATGSAAVGAGLGSAVTQGIATGDIDLKEALVAAATAGITSEFTKFLENTGALSSTEDSIARIEETMISLEEAGLTGGPAYQAAQQQLDILTGSLEAADVANQGSAAILNLVGEAADIYDTVRNVEDSINEFVNENEDAAWQTPDVSDILGNVQIQIRDYARELEERRRAGGGGGGAPEAGEETVDITTDDTTDIFDDGTDRLPTDIDDTRETVDEDVPTGIPDFYTVLEDGRVITVLDPNTPLEEDQIPSWVDTETPGTYPESGPVIEEEVAEEEPRIPVTPGGRISDPSSRQPGDDVEGIDTSTDTDTGDGTGTGTGRGSGTGTGIGTGIGSGIGSGIGEGIGDGSGSGAGASRGMLSQPRFTPYTASIGYQPVQLQQIIAPPKKDYMKQLDDLIGRGLFGKMLG